MEKIQLFCEGKPLGKPVEIDHLPYEEDYLVTGDGTKLELRRIRKYVHQAGKITELHVSAPCPWVRYPA
jgi:hypothetical protein